MTPTTPPPASAAELVERLTVMYSHRGDGIPTQYVNPDGPEAATLIASQAARIAELEAESEALKERLRNSMPLSGNHPWQPGSGGIAAKP